MVSGSCELREPRPNSPRRYVGAPAKRGNTVYEDSEGEQHQETKRTPFAITVENAAQFLRWLLFILNLSAVKATYAIGGPSFPMAGRVNSRLMKGECIEQQNALIL